MKTNVFQAKVEWDKDFGRKALKFVAEKYFQQYVNTLEVGDEFRVTITKIKKSQRTHFQNNALWMFLTLLAESLNASGKDMRVVLKPSYSIPWSKDTVHDHIWVPIQKALYGTESTTELAKIGQIENIHQVIMRELGEKHGVEYIPWPNDPDEAPFKLSK